MPEVVCGNVFKTLTDAIRLDFTFSRSCLVQNNSELTLRKTLAWWSHGWEIDLIKI